MPCARPSRFRKTRCRVSPPAWACRPASRCRFSQMSQPSSLEALIQALRCLPGVGPKSAQRMAYHLLQHDQQGAARLADAMRGAIERVRHCAMCNTFTEAEICDICLSTKRDPSLLCVVEMPGDLLM